MRAGGLTGQRNSFKIQLIIGRMKSKTVTAEWTHLNGTFYVNRPVENQRHIKRRHSKHSCNTDKGLKNNDDK